MRAYTNGSALSGGCGSQRLQGAAKGLRSLPRVADRPRVPQASKRTGYQDVPSPAFQDFSLGTGSLDALDNYLYDPAYVSRNGGQGSGGGRWSSYDTQPAWGAASRYQQQRLPLDSPQSYYDGYGDDDYESDGYDEFEPVSSAPTVKPTVNGKPLVINNEITASSVRVIGGEMGKQQRGVMTLQAALAVARDLEVDLVLLNAEAEPPLCRLVSWSKYKYEVEKEQKKKASKSTSVETKEVRLRPGTDANDIAIKLKSVLKFLSKGNKVKLSMRFEGRELRYKEQGKAVMLKFVEDCGAGGKLDGPVNFKTGTYTAILSPTGRPSAAAKAADAAGPTVAAAVDGAVAAAAAAAAAVAGNGDLPLPPPLPPTAPQKPQPTAAPAVAQPPPPPPHPSAAPPATPVPQAPVAAPGLRPPSQLPPPLPPARPVLQPTRPGLPPPPPRFVRPLPPTPPAVAPPTAPQRQAVPVNR